MEEKEKNPVSGAFSSLGAWCSKMGKWFYAFVAAAVLLIGAIVAIIVIAVNANKTPEVPPIVEGAETGIYYYDTVLGEYNIALNSGNKFTITGPDLNKTGEYAVSGTTITLDFIKDEDGTATATLDGDQLALVYNNATMNFLKKVPYTVTFNTSGGSAVDAVTVINGKTAAKPNDPAKEGSIFLGWYADEAFTKAFLFGTTPVKENTTVYAKWAATVPGQDEYVVDFDLGYEADAPANISTVGGKLVFDADYTAPTREGYTFVGWFVSAYEDGSKLTYAATEGTALNANTTLFAVWTDNAATKLATPVVSVVGNTISWDAVDGANAYQVTVTDAEGNVFFDQSVGTTTQSYDFASAAAGDYVITVVAKGTPANSDAAVRYYQNKALDRVSKFSVVGSTLIFNAVANAEKYLITVDCGNDAHNHTLFDNGKSNVYNFENCPMQAGGIVFTVTATAEGYASSVSEAYTHVLNLDKVGEIAFDEQTQSFSWASVANAAKYYVTVSCANHTHAMVDNGTATTYSVKSCSGEITISVFPATAGFNSPEATEATYTKTVPAAPENVTVSNMTVSWDAVEGVTNYILKIDGNSYRVNGATVYDLANSGISFVRGNTYTVSVQAVGATANSLVSDTVKFTYLTMGTISYHNNTVSWAPVAGSAKFEVKVNNEDSIIVDNTTSANVRLSKAGVNKIYVRTADFANAEWSSIEVVGYAVNYDTRSISGGTFTEYVAVGDNLTLPTNFVLSGYDFDAWYNAPDGAEGNGAEYTETVFNGNGAITLYANWMPKSYEIEIVGIDSAMSGAATGDKCPVTYTKNYTLPVLTTTDTVNSSFAGWYTGPGGTGTKLTDYLGNSITPYNITNNSYAYPYFTSGLVFVIQPDETYAVKKGDDIGFIPVITIPETYNDIAVTAILENGFYNCDNLVEINIPDTIQLIGTGAFSSCDALKSINIYETEGTHEVFYSSHEGALLFTDAISGYTYLEVFPRAKTGSFTIPDTVDAIRNRAFNYAKISSLTIPKNVTMIGSNAFSNCRSLKDIVFEEGGTVPVSIATNAFYGCYAATYIKLPALVKGAGEDEEFNVATLDYLTALETIEVEKATGAYYSAVDGMLCNTLGDTILYCPKAYTGISGVLTIPKGITAIGDSIFRARNVFTEIVIPNYVTSIGKYAFYGCTNVAKITIEGSRTRELTIGDSAFYGCSNAREVIFGGNGGNAADLGATTIGANAFSGQSELRTLTIEAGANIAEIGSSAFFENLKLRAIDIADGAVVTKIGSNAFKGCEGLTSFTIPASTTSIGDSAFEDCAFISKIIFAPNGQSIDFGSYVFKNCVALSRIELPATVKSFDGSAFDGCYSITEIAVDPANTSLETINGILYDENVTEIMFYPKGIDDPDLSELPWDTLTKIGNTVFKDNPNITSVSIPKNVTVIGNEAFNGCINLTAVTIANDGTTLSVGDYAFANCQKLTNISLPSYTTSIGNYAFYITPLTSFDTPADVTLIGNFAFAYTNISSINIPAKVTLIGDGAFAYSKLTEITFTEGTEPLAIGSIQDFKVNYNFESTEYNIYTNAKPFPASAIDIEGVGVFRGTGLVNVSLPARATSIGVFAFYDVDTLTTVTFPVNANLKAIGDGAFFDSALTSITLENTKLETVGEFAFAQSKLTGVVFPNTVTLIDKYAFSDIGTIVKTSLTPCLASVEFVTGGTEKLTVNNNAFRNSVFTSITFPKRLDVCTETIRVISASESYGVNIKSFYTIFEGNYSLAAVNVEDGCQKYVSRDGIFYEKDASGNPGTLIYCPPAKTGEVVIPNTVTHVESRAFFVSQLTKITFEEFAKDSENYGKAILTIGNTESANLTPYTVFGGSARSTVTASTYRNAPSKVYYNFTTSTFYSAIAEINFPSHLKTINSCSVFNVRTNGFTVNFNKDGEPVEFTNYAMYSNDGLTVLDLPKVKSLSGNSWFSQTFSSNKNLVSVSFAEGSTVTVLPYYGFQNCSSLTTIDIPASVTLIDEECFLSCKALTTINWGDSKVQTIASGAFAGTGLTSFKFPDSVTTVGEMVFENCKSLTSVELGLGVTSISAPDANGNASSIFRGCTALTEVIVPQNHPTLKSENGVVYDYQQTIIYLYPRGKTDTSFTIPATVTEIADYAFHGYQGASITLPANLARINYGAFAASALTSIHIPASVITIQNSAFNGSGSLAAVTFAENSQLTYIGSSAFYGCALTSIVLPDNVSYIDNSAFSNNQSLTSAVLPAALKAVPQTAFSSCKKLKTVTLQEGLETIGYQAFQYCSALQSVVIPASVKTISGYAFYQDTALANVTLAEGSQLESIMNFAFKESKITELVLPESLKELGHGVFYKCPNLKLVDLSATQLTELPYYIYIDSYNVPDYSTIQGMFEGSAKLETVLLPETLEVIDRNCFKGCVSLKAISIPAAVMSIGHYAFDGCEKLATVQFAQDAVLTALGSDPTAESAIFRGTESLKAIALPESIVSIGANIFEGSGLETIQLPEKLSTVSVAAFKDCVNLTVMNIPGTVTDIHEQAFYGCSELTSLTLNEGLETIGQDAFGNCSKITEIKLPATLLRMGGNPFSNCTGLVNFELASGNESFVIDDIGVLYDVNMRTVIFYPSYLTSSSYTMPSTVFELASSAFAGSKLQNIVISDNIKVIPNGCFTGSALLESVSIPLSVTTIEDGAFRDCAKLNNVVIPTSTVSIGNYAFAGCESLTAFDFGTRNVELSLGTHLFSGCTSLANVILPETMTAIRAYMFENTGIVNLVIPNSVIDLSAEGIFRNCAALESITFPEGYEGKIGAYAFAGCTSLESVELPDALTEISIGMFMDCSNLTTVTMGDSISAFNNECFKNCSKLLSFDIPSDCWFVGAYAFANCTSLTVMDFSAMYYMDWYDHAFEGCTGLTEFYLPLEFDSLYGGDFAGCTNIEILYLGMPYWIETDSFEGWTEDQTICFYSEDYTLMDLIDWYGIDWMTTHEAVVTDLEGNIAHRDGTITNADGEVIYTYEG